MDKKNNIKEIAAVFFKLGCFAFGGPAAHIAMMESEIVEKRKWLSRQHYLDLIGATNLIPGPNSTEMTMHCGYERGGKLGLFVAGISFIFPAVVITGFLAWLYVTYGQVPDVKPFIFGIKPAVIAIIAAAILKLGKKAVKSVELAVIGGLVVGISFAGVNEILALLSAGLLGGVYFYAKNKTDEEKPKINKNFVLPFLTLQSSALLTSSISALKIFWIFLKVGAVLYGSGYVLFAYLDAELVETGYMARQELMDAIAVGQFTPGPVLSTATFVGWQLGGFWGAITASVGIFLPSFLFVLILNPLLPKMRKSKIIRGFLESVNVAAVAIMLVVLLVMFYEVSVIDIKTYLFDWRAIVITMLSILVTFGFKKVSVMWIVAGSSLMGYLLLLI